jgi:hypothetical protein
MIIDVRPRTWCRLLCEITAFCAALPFAVTAGSHADVSSALHTSMTLGQPAAVQSPFSSEDLPEEPDTMWVGLSNTSAAATGAATSGTQPIVVTPRWSWPNAGRAIVMPANALPWTPG